MAITERTVTTKTFDDATLERRREERAREEQIKRAKYPAAWWDPGYYADPRNAYATSSIFSPGKEQQAVSNAKWQRQQIATQASMFGDEAPEMMLRYLDTGYVAPGTASALAQIARGINLPDEVLGQLSLLDSLAATDQDSKELGSRKVDQNSNENQGFLERVLGEVTRPVFALLTTPYELVQGTMRSTVGAIQGEGFDNPWDQTLGGQYISGLFGGRSADLGDGWFPNGDVAARQAAAARDAAPLVHGSAWTLGRGVGSLLFTDPDSLAYNLTSGLIDMTAAIALDPLVATGVAAKTARAARTGQRQAIAGREGRAAQEAIRAHRAAGAGEEALTRPQTWLDQETFNASAEYVRTATREFTSASRRMGEGRMSRIASDATDRHDRVASELLLARDDASAASRRVEDTQVAARQTGQRVRRLRNALGDDVIASQSARAAREAPDLPGSFTVEIPARGTTLPGATDGVDSIVTVRSRDALKSVDDRIENPADLANALKVPQGASEAVSTAVRRMRENAKREGATYGDLIKTAERSGVGASLMVGLRQAGVDGVTDVFRLKNGTQGGVWWTTPNVDVAKWIDGSYKRIDNSLPATQARVRDIDRIEKDVRAQRDRIAGEISGSARAAEELAAHFDSVMNGITDVSDAPQAVRTAVEYAMGVRRDINGRPRMSREGVKEFFFGTPHSFDKAIGGVATKRQQATIAADRALIAGATLGTSEAVRAIGKFAAKPFITKVRQRLLDDLVRMGDTSENLGRLHRLTNGKIPPQVMRAILRAEDEESVLAALAPNMGVNITKPLAANPMQAGRSQVSELRNGRMGDWLFNRAARWIEREASIVPRGLTAISLTDPQKSSNDLRNYLANIRNLDTDTIDDIVGNYLRASNEPARHRAIKNGFDRVAEVLVEENAKTRLPNGRYMSEATKDALTDRIKSATRLYEGGHARINTWWNEHYAADANIGTMTINGQRVSLPGPQLEAELARGGMVLPRTEELRKAIGRWGAFIESGPGKFTERIRDFANYTNDVWRASVLLRPAYVLRNIGEMQTRMFLAGHTNMFSNPLQVLGFATAASTKSSWWRDLAARFAKANETATGFTLSKPSVEDMRATDGAMQEFQDVMTRTTSRQDMRSHRAAEAFHGVETVGRDQPGFARGYADQMMLLHNSRLARIVAGQDPEEVAARIARGEDRESVIIDWVLNSDTARPIRQEYAEGDPSFSRIFGAPDQGVPGDPQALRAFLFGTEEYTGSIADRIRYYTQGRQELVDFIASGRLYRNGQVRFDKQIKTTDAAQYAQEMERRLPKLTEAMRPFIKELPDDTEMELRILRSRGNAPTDDQRMLDGIFDRFFHWSGRMENAAAVGPEFAYAYHQKLAELLPSIRKADRQQVFDTVMKSESRIRRRSESAQTAKAGLRAQEEGFLTVDDASAAAAQHASEHVKTFFYDAMRRREIFHALRVVMPFAQSMVDTLWRWGSLAAQRPYMMEKVGRLGIGLQEEGSGVIYDAFDAIDPFANGHRRDPTQGFLYEDPMTGETRFTFPLIGSGLAAVMAPIASAATGESIGMGELAQHTALSAPLKNLNIALQGDVDYLPGLGPMITMPAGALLPEDWFGGFPEWFQSWAFPYGRPDLEGGVVESTFLPSWARRLTGVMWNDEFRSYAIKPSMSYLMSRGHYDVEGSPQERQDFIDDTKDLTRILTFIRAVGASVLPAAPTNDVYIADQDGRFIATNYLADHYQHMIDDAAGDSEAATQAFIDTYGLDAIAAIVPASEGEYSFSGPAWEFFKDNPDRAQPFSDVLGMFFPGEFSLEAYSFQTNSSARRKLSVEERTDAAVRYLYNARRTQLEAKASREEWDPETMDEAEEELKRQFGGVLPRWTGQTVADQIDKMRQALNEFPELASTRGGEGAQMVFEAYDTYIEEAERRWGDGASLSAERAEGLREDFLNDLARITGEYGGYDRADGSVDTVVRKFVSHVTPRGE